MTAFTLDSITLGSAPARPVAVVYAIENGATGKRYVGSTTNARARWNWHRSALRRGVHHSAHLQRSWAKYGAAAFAFVTLAELRHMPDLLATEQGWIHMTRAADPAFGYNVGPVAGSCAGVKHGPAARANYAAAAKRKGISAETRAKMNAARRGKPRNAETIEKMRAANLGRVHSPETRAKMSAAHRARHAARRNHTPTDQPTHPGETA